MKTFFLSILCFITFNCFSQYIGVKVRYTDTRLVDNSPLPPSRENRLILSFFKVSDSGVYTPTILPYDIAIYKEGLQYGSPTGGVTDSSGNNYPGYLMTAPHVVAYSNSYSLTSIECDPNLVTTYPVSGQELDCGFIRVSHWVMDTVTGFVGEIFTAPNVCLPFYYDPHPYSIAPGNLNFTWPITPTPPYNKYGFTCTDTVQYAIMRGVIPHADPIGPLPVRFANVKGHIDAANKITISWSNLTESDILQYVIERSVDGISFHSIGTVLPAINNGSRADYSFFDVQTDKRNYYRIKAVENNRRFFYSTVISLTAADHNSNPGDNNPSLSIYPNPVSDGTFTFRLTNAEKGNYSYSLYNPSGRQLFYKLILHNGGDIIRQVNLTGLASGVYQLVMRSENKKYSQKIVYVN